MAIPYDVFTGAFLSKVTEFDLLQLDENNRTELIDRFRTRAVAAFKKNCKVDLFTTADDVLRCYDVDVSESDLDELADIISEGMVVQWLKPYVNQQDLLQNVMTTRDYSLYSSAELLSRVGSAYREAKKDFIQMIREYSYNHGDLTDLHL